MLEVVRRIDRGSGSVPAFVAAALGCGTDAAWGAEEESSASQARVSSNTSIGERASCGGAIISP